MGDTYVNRFGRRGGRGVRPWLLAPKVVCVGLYLGGLAAAWVVVAGGGMTDLPAGDGRRELLIELVGRLYRWLIIPALVGALVFGVGLMLQHPGTFLRLRWLVVKLVGLMVLLPAGHAWSRSRLMMLREGGDEGEARQLLIGLAVVLAGSVGVIVLARLKPRLGQNWARDYAGPRGAG